MIDVSKLKGLTQDSRKVQPGFLFAAFPGSQSDGRDYIDAAIEKGAVAILAPEGTQVSGDVEVITDPEPRLAFARLAAEFYGAQPETIIAVTGTNGKTSVVSFAEQLWQAVGKNATSLGTLKGLMTTPDPVGLHAHLKELADDGITHLAMEASSHGLDQYRLDGVKLKAAGFTNLSRDHLDYHGDMQSYFKAKARLFSEVLADDGLAVLNADEEHFEALKNVCDQRGIRVISYGVNGNDIKVLSREALPKGQAVRLEVFEKQHDLEFPLVGEFQLMNALCALGLVMAQDADAAYVDALAHLKGAKGRLESVPGLSDAAVYIDYAHTPDALENVLNALRPHTENKLVCIFGCGGDRDKGKRPQMGELATKLADHVIVTDDNPRTENPDAIRSEILKGAPGAHEIGDRHEAITHAIGNLASGDVLVIAGKGHEQGQIFADRTEDFDDANEAAKAIQRLSLKREGN